MTYQAIDRIAIKMSCKPATNSSCGYFGASIVDVQCKFSLISRRDSCTPQPLCVRCHNNVTRDKTNENSTLCAKCKWQEKTGLLGVNFTHTPLGGQTVPLSRASLALKPGGLSSEERTEWQNTIKAELTKPRFKIGDLVVPVDNVGWGRLLKKGDDETLAIPPSHGKGLSDQIFEQYLDRFQGNDGADSHSSVDGDSGSEGFILVTSKHLDISVADH